MDTKTQMFEIAKAGEQMLASVPASDPFRPFFMGLVAAEKPDPVKEFLAGSEARMAKANAVAAAYRKAPRKPLSDVYGEVMKGLPEELVKANMDVGTLTNFAQITGGQSLGFVSLDTQMARGTVRPSSFTLYQSLNKTHAYQVVDYWPYASDTGGGLPGTSFASFSSVGTGTMATSAGKYELENIFLKLAVNGRAITTALAAQNSFVDIAQQENANAALTILETLNWSSFWGDSTMYANQFNGLGVQIPSANWLDYQAFKNTYATAQGWSDSQTMFNAIYQWAGQITSYNQFGRITHAFMSPQVAASMNSLVTGVLNNVVTSITGYMAGPDGIVVNGDLQGMRTRFGEIQFPIDIFINVRDKPAQAIKMADGTTFATSTNPTPPASVTVTAITGVTGQAFQGGVTVAGNDWTGAYLATGQFATYAVASTDANMNESTLTWATAVSGVAANGGYNIAIAGPAAADATAFRIYRSGLTSPAVGNTNPAAVRYIGTVTASGSGTVNYKDANLHIPGSETVFLLDLDERDMALDFRYLLPLTKVELFAQNLYMPWAVAAIGAVRCKIAKFHGLIYNFVPENADFNPLAANASAV